MWRLVLALLALLSSICEKYGFIGVLIFFCCDCPRPWDNRLSGNGER